MITDITTDTATIILPVADFSDSEFYRLNNDLGDLVLVEVDLETQSFVKFHIDYSLIGFDHDDISDATGEAQAVYDYMLEFFGTTGQVDINKWKQELIDYYQQQYSEYVAEWGEDDSLTQSIKKRLLERTSGEPA